MAPSAALLRESPSEGGRCPRCGMLRVLDRVPAPSALSCPGGFDVTLVPHRERVDRDEAHTKSICPVCKAAVDAEVNARDNKDFLRKRCRDHGVFEASTSTRGARGEKPALVVTRPHHLYRTVTIALVVGTILVAINQLDVVLRGDADTVTWIKTAVTYVVPFCVSSAGLLVGTHRPARTGR